jgi:hypothetical protein
MHVRHAMTHSGTEPVSRLTRSRLRTDTVSSRTAILFQVWNHLNPGSISLTHTSQDLGQYDWNSAAADTEFKCYGACYSAAVTARNLANRWIDLYCGHLVRENSPGRTRTNTMAKKSGACLSADRQSSVREVSSYDAVHDKGRRQRIVGATNMG